MKSRPRVFRYAAPREGNAMENKIYNDDEIFAHDTIFISYIICLNHAYCNIILYHSRADGVRLDVIVSGNGMQDSNIICFHVYAGQRNNVV